MAISTLRRHGLRLVLPLLPGLATLVLLVLVLLANVRIVENDLAQRAQYRAVQVASIFAGQVSQMVSRLSSELELTGRLLLRDDLRLPADLHAELERLRRHTGSYAWIGWVDPQGHLLVATDAPGGPAPGAPLLRPAQASAEHPVLLTTAALPGTPPPMPPAALGVLVVPVREAQGATRGALVAALDRDHFDTMRQFALGNPAARRSMDLALLDAAGTTALGPVPSEAPGMVVGRADLRGIDSRVVVRWQAVATQPEAAATRPATQLQDQLLLMGLPAALLIGGLGLWLSLRLARPYQQVVEAVSRSASGHDGQAPGAFLRAVAEALRRLAPDWDVSEGTQALLEHMIQDAQRLQQVLDQLPTPVYLLDEAGLVSFWNRQSEDAFGWPAAEALGRPIDDLLPGQVHQGLAASTDGEAQAFEARTETRSGEERWGEWRVLPLRAPDGQALGQIVLVRDITDRVRASADMARHQDELAELNHQLMQQEQATTRRLAQTLHDQLGQTLGAVRLTFDSLQPVWRNATDARHQERAARLGRLIDQAVGEVRQALTELRPPLLEERGLAQALDNEVQMRRAEVAPAELVFGTDALTQLTRWPDDVEHAAFMVAREAIANAARHAHAHQIRLTLEGNAHQLTLAIEDDGQGMAASQRGDHPGHLGLVGMRERALAIGARLRVLPAQPHGLRVTLTWPAQPMPPTSRDTT